MLLSKKRGENYILVYKIIGSEENIIQIEAGYKYNLNKKINVKIDNANFDFYSTEDSSETAWTNDDKKVIYAMKKIYCKSLDKKRQIGRASCRERV